MCLTIKSVVQKDLEGQLKMLEAKMSAAVCERLRSFLECDRQRGSLVHHYIELIIDPQNKDMKKSLMDLHGKDVSKARSMAKKNDEEVIIPLLVKLHHSEFESDSNSNEEVTVENKGD